MAKKVVIGDNKLILGDGISSLGALGKESVDLVCTDMPYGTTRCKWDNCVDLDRLWRAYAAVCKDNTAFLMFSQTPFDKVLGCSNIKYLRYEIIWHKHQATGHFNAKKMPMKAHENILVFYKKLPTYNPIKTQGHLIKRVSTGKVHKSAVYGREYIKPDYHSTSRYPRSVQSFASDRQTSKLHPTQKPLALLEWLVTTYSNPGDTVLDNFMGSCTTGHACTNLGRNFVGIDNSEEAFNTSVQRIEAAENIR